MDTGRTIKLVECPRDAMQGWPVSISTAVKTKYLNALIRVGFHTLDFGSFVSPRAVPQMADTAEVLDSLDLPSDRTTRLLAIVANEKGASNALEFEQVDVLGYPLSVSETFQQNNTHTGIEESFLLVSRLAEQCNSKNRSLVVYLSMAFGNPYGDLYSSHLVVNWAKRLHALGIETIYLADTVGNAGPGDVATLFKTVIEAIPNADLGLHLHAIPAKQVEMISAAFETGCLRIDSSIRGIGGCPFASHELTGNLPTEKVIEFLKESGIKTQSAIDMKAFNTAFEISAEVFMAYKGPFYGA